MTGLELLLTAGAVAGKEAVKSAVTALYDASAGKAKKALKASRNDREINKLFQQLWKIRKVKTLGQLDKAVDLTSFYCDSHVYVDRTTRRRIQQIEDLGVDANILIEGIAGQGKSIFLRYLCSVEALKGKLLPIFVELRRIQEHQTLSALLIKTLKGFHIDVDDDSLGELADSGRMILLLDAFDEVRDDAKERVLDEIESFAALHEKLQIIVTSRPESGIRACPLFRVVRLSDLERDEYATVIMKIADDAELAEELIKQVKSHKGGIRDLLLTPLLVTLLVIRYKSYQELPEQLADFYDSLFQLLLQRHDGIKPGYRRARRCGMNDYQYRQVFEAFCFSSKKFQGRQFKQPDAYRAAEAALKSRFIDDDPEGFVEDIVKVTCLLVKDGEEYRFIHKSVQEYYAAAYIKQKSEVVSEKLYRKLFDTSDWWRFSQELRFLEEIDSYRFSKFGALPYLSRFFSVDINAFDVEPTKDAVARVQRCLADCKIHVHRDGNTFYVNGLGMPDFGPLTMRMLSPFEELIIDPLFDEQNTKSENPLSAGTTTSEMPLHEVLTLLGKRARGVNVEKAAKQTAKMLFNFGSKAAEIVRKEEQFDPFLSLSEPG